MKKYNVLILCVVFVCRLAFANDSAGTTAAGGVQFIRTPSVKMVSENLTISPTNIAVDYLFQNLSDKAVTTPVFFPLPPYRMLGMNESWDDEVAHDKNAPFKNFSVIVNGHAVAYQVKTQAMFNGKDITSTLIKNGIPLNAQLAAGQIPMDAQQALKFKQWHAKAFQLKLLDAQGNPGWQKQVIYYWTQTFPAKQNVTISHQYKPAAGEFYVAKTPNISQQTPSVMDAIQRIKILFNADLLALENGKNLQSWLTEQSVKPTGSNAIYAFIYNVDYILTTGANWAGPIQQFTLTLNYPNNGVIAYNHFYKDKTSKLKVIPGKTKLVLSNFVPRQDLHILFGVTSLPR